MEPRIPRILNKKTDSIPPGAYYCGRPGPLGNPFVIGRDGTRDDVVDKFDTWVQTQPKLMAIIATLEGRDLVCWCAPFRCHCEPIRRLANPRLFAEAVGTTATAEQIGADGTKLSADREQAIKQLRGYRQDYAEADFVSTTLDARMWANREDDVSAAATTAGLTDKEIEDILYGDG